MLSFAIFDADTSGSSSPDQSTFAIFIDQNVGARALTGPLYWGLSVGRAADLLVGPDH
jgi:hypothetical protein